MPTCCKHWCSSTTMPCQLEGFYLVCVLMPHGCASLLLRCHTLFKVWNQHGTVWNQYRAADLGAWHPNRMHTWWKVLAAGRVTIATHAADNCGSTSLQCKLLHHSLQGAFMAVAENNVQQHNILGHNKGACQNPYPVSHARFDTQLRLGLYYPATSP